MGTALVVIALMISCAVLLLGAAVFGFALLPDRYSDTVSNKQLATFLIAGSLLSAVLLFGLELQPVLIFFVVMPAFAWIWAKLAWSVDTDPGGANDA